MIQGLGEAHNADVLLDPPVQTPFLYRTRLLVECKDHKRAVGLDVVRDALGLREDVNHFELVDKNDLLLRKTQRRQGIIHFYERYSYQVAIASMSGYSIPAQQFAATHRIPLIEFSKMSFWNKFKNELHNISNDDSLTDEDKEGRIIRLADDIGRRMAVAITNSGQILFLYRETGDATKLANVTNEFEMRKEAINCKIEFLSNMLVYYIENGKPTVNMISINKDRLKEANDNFKKR